MASNICARNATAIGQTTAMAQVSICLPAFKSARPETAPAMSAGSQASPDRFAYKGLLLGYLIKDPMKPKPNKGPACTKFSPHLAHFSILGSTTETLPL
jgi:hypothetical protein